MWKVWAFWSSSLWEEMLLVAIPTKLTHGDMKVVASNAFVYIWTLLPYRAWDFWALARGTHILQVCAAYWHHAMLMHLLCHVWFNHRMKYTSISRCLSDGCAGVCSDHLYAKGVVDAKRGWWNSNQYRVHAHDDVVWRSPLLYLWRRARCADPGLFLNSPSLPRIPIQPHCWALWDPLICFCLINFGPTNLATILCSPHRSKQRFHLTWNIGTRRKMSSPCCGQLRVLRGAPVRC